MGKKFKILSLFFFVSGMFLVINSKLNITGAVIGNSNFLSTLTSTFGLIFILVSILFFAYSGKLEEKLIEVEEEELGYENPVIIDTNYILESCKDGVECKKLLKFIKERYNLGQPVIVPRGVFEEFRFVPHGNGAENRMQPIMEALAKYTITMENIRGEEWGSLDKKVKSNALAKEILCKTPKYLAYEYLSEIDKGEKITVEKFLRKNIDKLNNAFSEKTYEDILQNARREYERINDKTGVKGRKNFLRTYNLSPTDMEILSSALYLQEFPDVFGDELLDKVNIITKDSHLIDSLKIFNNLYPRKKGKMNVLDKI
jgi:hypothetical protein